MKHAILVLTHKPVNHLVGYAEKYKNLNFYIHIDAKCSDAEIISPFNNISNVFFVKEREDINWAGFSMVQATLNLINTALTNHENEFFHLISGDDVILNPDNMSWNNAEIFIEFKPTVSLRYRNRFNTIHADTLFQRKFFGKILTQCYRIVDKLKPSSRQYYFGSQWFSIRRNELSIMNSRIDTNLLLSYKKKLCPDEFFFQELIQLCKFEHIVSNDGNHRHIVFDSNYQRGSSPKFLDREQVLFAKKNNFWFARKVESVLIQEFLKLND